MDVEYNKDMKKIQNIASGIFITAVAVLSVVAVLGIWELFDGDVISKSFQTLGLLAFVAVIVMAAGRFVESRSHVEGEELVEVVNPIFPTIRRVTLLVLIISVSLLALLGVLSIWEVIKDEDVLFKSLSSLGSFAFGAFIIVLSCLERENKINKHGHISIGRIIVTLILAYVLFSIFGLFLMMSAF